MYRVVARMLRGDVACLIAGAGVLAFVVTTNAEKLIHVSGPVDAPETMGAAAAGIERGGLQTATDQAPDWRLAIPRPRTAGAPNGGAAAGGIAGGDPSTSQTFGFEVGEGFAVGYIDGQAGWAAGVASAVEPHVDTDNPAAGDQHLRLSFDPALSANTVMSAFSPNMGTFENTSAIVSVETYVTGTTNRDYDVAPQTPTEGLVVQRVRFSRSQNVILALNDAGNLVNTGATWIPDQYVNLTIDLDAVAGTIDIIYNGGLIHSNAVLPAGTAVQEVVILGTNGGGASPGHADFDNVDVAGGPPPTGACCNFDGLDGCEVITPAACSEFATAFYLGDGTTCDICPPVPAVCGGGGDCLVAHDPTPGCDDIGCCALVCDQIPFCCQVGIGWTAQCAAAALDSFCAPEPACGAPGTGSCTAGNNGTQFCDDTCDGGVPCPGCCETVCAVDPYCCETQWDSLCDGEGATLCGCDPGDVPANDLCTSAEELFVGPPVPTDNNCGSAGPPKHADCTDTFVTGLGIDIWYFHNATFNGALNVIVTPDDDGAWNTQIAVYEGCDCGLLSDPPYVCAPIDDQATVPVSAGTCYLIRLGGTYDGPVGTGTIQLAAVPDACLAAANDCLQAAGTAGCSDLSCCAIVCISDPNCCDVAWDQDCADAAQVSCSPLPCPAIDTGSANVDEAEICGLDVNGGCNSDPAVFTEIVSGDVIAGNAWADAGSRDTDWYRLTIDPAADVNLDGMVDVHYSTVSELPIANFLIRDLDPTCGPGGTDPDLVSTTGYGQSCTCVLPGVGTVNVTDAIYVFAGAADEAGNPIFEGYPCGLAEGPGFGGNYLLSVDVTDNGEPSPQTCGAVVKNPCPWDCQPVPEGTVGINDFLALLAQWTMVGTSCDQDGTPGVGINDFLDLLAAWGPCPQ